MLRATAQKALRRATTSLRSSNTNTSGGGVFSPKQQKRSMSGGGSIEEEIGTNLHSFFISLPHFSLSFSLSLSERVTIEKRSLSLSLKALTSPGILSYYYS